MSLIRRSASPDFPFSELSSEDFHRLALHLFDREPDVLRVENYGASGSDGGIDLIADQVPSELDLARRSTSVPTIVQVKRVKAFTATHARREVDRLKTSGKYKGFGRYLLFTSCTPSSAAIDTLREGCADLGIREVEVWDKSLLTARLLRYPDLVEFFFGLSGTPLDDPGRTSTYLSVRRLVGEGHPLVLVVGAQPEFDFAPGLSRDVLAPGEALRWLIDNRVVDAVVAQGTDFSLTLGDLLEVDESPRAPRGHALWQPHEKLPLGPLVVELLEARRDEQTEKPLLVMMGCDSRQSASVAEVMPDIDARLAEEALFFGTPEPGPTPLSAVSASGHSFLRSLQEMLAPEWLVFHLTKLDFSKPFAFPDIVAGRTVEPGIVHSGFWRSGAETDTTTGIIPIAGLPGSGKTARAFRIGYELCPQSTYYLDLAAFPGVTSPDLGRVLLWLREESDDDALLILDNFQTAPSASRNLRVPRGSGARVYLVTVETQPFASLEMLGGEVQPEVLEPGTWRSSRTELARWCEEQGARGENLHVAEQSASNLWHFFYLLRGGAATLTSGLEAARRDKMSDVVWYAIAALQVFRKEVATVRGLYAELTEHALWPITVEEGKRGRWLIDRIESLLEAQLVIPVASGFTCRHPFEAFGVLRLSFEYDSQLTAATFREASIRFFAQAMPQIEIPAKLKGDPADFEKRDFHAFARDYLSHILDRQRELEQAVSYDVALSEIVNEVWRELIELVESWPAHPLYWLFNYTRFTDNLLRFSPFHSIKRLAAFDQVECESDAIDLEYAVKGMVAYEALRTARFRTELARGRGSLEERLGEAEGYVQLLSGLRDSGKAGSGIDEYAGEIEAVETTIKLMKAEIAVGEKYEGKEMVIPFETDLRPGDAWGLEQSARWLEHQAQSFSKVAENVDIDRLVASLSNLIAARPLLLAHLWLFSRRLGEEVFGAMPPVWREEVVEQVKRSADSYTPLHLSASDDGLAIFVSELALVEPRIRAWLGESEARVIAERIGSTAQGGIRPSQKTSRLEKERRRRIGP